MSKQVKAGDTIKVHYTGAHTNGEVFDSSRDRDPLEFKVGAGMMIKGFDAGVVGLTVGEKARLEIKAEDGYGERRDDMTFDVPKDKIPAELNIEEGTKLMMPTAGGPFPVVVAKIAEDTVTLDANHELAGADLVFDIEVMEIA